MGEIPDLAGVHGIAIASDLGRGFTSNGHANSSTIIDLKTLKPLGTVATGAWRSSQQRNYGAKAVGVDNNPKRTAEAQENAAKEGVTNLVTLIQQNTTDLSGATVVTMSPPQSSGWLGLNGLLNPTLTGQLKPGSRLSSGGKV